VAFPEGRGRSRLGRRAASNDLPDLGDPTIKRF
jgi:hypothetical protein